MTALETIHKACEDFNVSLTYMQTKAMLAAMNNFAYGEKNKAEKDSADVKISNMITNYLIYYFDLKDGEIYEKNKKGGGGKKVMVRQLAMIFIKMYTKLSLESVGKKFGMTHANVKSSIKTVNNRVETEPGYAKTFHEIDKKLKIKIVNI